MIALAGDDHGAKSSTLPHQSDHIFKACGLPVFYPSTVQEYLDLGLHGWAMPQGRWLLPAHAELSPALIAKAIAARLLEPGRYGSRFELAPDVRAGIESRLAILAAKERSLAAPHTVVERTPTFCSGCPHNTSTHVPEGSRALAGIGCHYMTTWMPERRTGTFTPASRARRAGAQRQAARAGGAASGAARVRAGGPASKARRVRGEVRAPTSRCG